MRRVFERFRLYNLKLKPKKCSFLRSEIEFLGKLVTREGIGLSPSKRDVMASWPQPTTKKELESFLGYVIYHRAHVKQYAQLMAPLYHIAKPTSTFEWSDEHTQAFSNLKEQLSSERLKFPTPNMFVLDCDASNHTIAAELSQAQNGKEETIAYASHVLLPIHRKYQSISSTAVPEKNSWL